jgi:hypothetical protein
MGGDDTVFAAGGLPIDWVKTLVELLGAGKLPLAEDGPKDGDTSDRSGNSDKHSQGCAFCLCNAGQGNRYGSVFGWTG